MSDSGDHHGRRREYDAATLSRAQLPRDPMILFGDWLQTVTDAGAKDATAMALATVGPGGMPSVRIVLLKSHDAQGFAWYTDCGSQKGLELQTNNQASAVFYWRDFDRQVRVTGFVSRIDSDTARQYFDSRPLESRFSAAASEQSSPIANREILEDRVQALQDQYPDGSVPMPERWGGYCLRPESVEFWQGREGRLHDRFLYMRDAQGGVDGWRIERLQP